MAALSDRRILETVDTEPRILLQNPDSDDECDLLSSDYSGSDEEYSPEEFAQKVTQLDDWDKAFLENFFGRPYDQVLQSALDQTLAPQAQQSGSRFTARSVPPRQLGKEMRPDESPLHGSCFTLLFQMTDGAYREKCSDLMEFLTEELTQVLNRQKVLMKAGKDAGYDSPGFQKAVAAWRKSLDMATDSASQAEQAKTGCGALTFEKTLERIRNRQPEEAKAKATGVRSARRLSKAPLADVYRKDCERLTMQLMCDATYSQQPYLLLELLVEDLQHVRRRQQVLFRAEMAAAMQPPAQKAALPNEILDPVNKSVASMNVGSASPHAANSGSSTAFHSGVANSTDTAEPNRCRRTGGKKWRCARNVVPGQKHCERHLHRGRQRSSSAATTAGVQLPMPQ